MAVKSPDDVQANPRPPLQFWNIDIQLVQATSLMMEATAGGGHVHAAGPARITSARLLTEGAHAPVCLAFALDVPRQSPILIKHHARATRGSQ